VYLVEVALQFDRSDKIAPQWLKDGMTVQASIQLQQLSLLEWLFLPLHKAIQRNPDFFS
jgi:membrane fusion protein